MKSKSLQISRRTEWPQHDNINVYGMCHLAFICRASQIKMTSRVKEQLGQAEKKPVWKTDVPSGCGQANTLLGARQLRDEMPQLLTARAKSFNLRQRE